MLYGLPGTGKTHLAKSLASETRLPFVQLSGADIQSKWINESSQQVKQLFDEGNEIATTHGGALIFVDELDSVLKARNTSGNAHAEDDKVVNEFLNHLENAKENGIVFVGATNRIECLDSAAIRSGRIDEKMKIGKPDYQTRRKILITHLDDRQHDISDNDISKLAGETEGVVAAELEQTVNGAAKQVLARDGKEIRFEDLKDCLNNIEGV